MGPSPVIPAAPGRANGDAMKLDKDLPLDIQQVLDTAGLLEISEFRVFELAHIAWYGPMTDTARQKLEKIFSAYMYGDVVPVWVRAFTRDVVARARTDHLDPADYGIHVEPPTPTMIYMGIRYALWVVLTLSTLMIGVHFIEPAVPGACFFPPCY